MRIGLGISVLRRLEWVVPILVDFEDRLAAGIEGRNFGAGVEEVVLGVDVIDAFDLIGNEDVEFHEDELSIEVYGGCEQVKNMLVLNISLIVNDHESIDAKSIQGRILREILSNRTKVEDLGVINFDYNDFFNTIQSIDF